MSISIYIDTIEHITITGKPVPSIRWEVGPVVKKQGGGMPLDIRLTNEEKVRLAVAPTTPGGQPAPVDGAAQWSSEGSCAVEPIDATSAWVISGTEIGDSVITVTVDADMGDGTVNIMDTATIHVESPMASNLGLSADEPELKNP